jgi:hypothetical protein
MSTSTANAARIAPRRRQRRGIHGRRDVCRMGARKPLGGEGHKLNAHTLRSVALLVGAACCTAQQDVGDGAESVCSIVLARGDLDCTAGGGYAELCPASCAAAAAGGTAAAPAVAWCDQVVERGLCASMADMCPAECSGAAAAEESPSFFTTCATLLELDGGCSHDLSVANPHLAPGTSVSDMCPDGCSGHVGCLPTALDISFLGAVDDASSRGDAAVELLSGACVDDSGLSLPAEGYAQITMSTQYAQSGSFSIALWVLPDPDEVLRPEGGRAPKTLYAHSLAGQAPQGCGGAGCGGVYIYLRREEWLDDDGGHKALCPPSRTI